MLCLCVVEWECSAVNVTRGRYHGGGRYVSSMGVVGTEGCQLNGSWGVCSGGSYEQRNSRLEGVKVQ